VEPNLHRHPTPKSRATHKAITTVCQWQSRGCAICHHLHIVKASQSSMRALANSVSRPDNFTNMYGGTISSTHSFTRQAGPSLKLHLLHVLPIISTISAIFPHLQPIYTMPAILSTFYMSCQSS
jgi:hypothetical protein